MRVARSGWRAGFDKPKATDDWAKTTAVTETTESKATTKATAALKTTQKNSAIFYNAALF